MIYTRLEDIVGRRWREVEMYASWTGLTLEQAVQMLVNVGLSHSMVYVHDDAE